MVIFALNRTGIEPNRSFLSGLCLTPEVQLHFLAHLKRRSYIVTLVMVQAVTSVCRMFCRSVKIEYFSSSVCRVNTSVQQQTFPKARRPRSADVPTAPQLSSVDFCNSYKELSWKPTVKSTAEPQIMQDFIQVCTYCLLLARFILTQQRNSIVAILSLTASFTMAAVVQRTKITEFK